jgi:hypothetical protein
MGTVTKDDMDQAIRLMEYARKNGYAIDHVEVGTVKLRMFDTRLEASEGLKQEPTRYRDIFEEHGVEGPAPDGTVG